MSVITDTFFGGDDRDAARAQEAGIQQSNEELRRQFDLNRQDLAPTIQAGDSARSRYQDFLGLNGVDAEQGAIDSFNESPGQRFLRERAERAVTRNAAATGGLQGGNVLKALQEQAIGLSGQFLGERKDRLAGVAGAGTNAAINGANIGTGLSNNIAGNEVGIGNARASGIMARSNAIRNSLGMVAGAFTGSGGLGSSSGIARGATAGTAGGSLAIPRRF